MTDKDYLLKEKYGGEESEAFLADCKRLDEGEPLAYIIGHIPFLDCTIYLDSKPLIPRPETEFWLNQIISEYQTKSNFKILDLCAGSGAMGVALLKHLKNIEVDFVEIDQSHHPTILKNIRENTTLSEDDENFHIYGSDLFSKIPSLVNYDLIVSNPPYVPKENNQTDHSVLQHEPHQALFAGNDGLDFVKRIIEESANYLNPDGVLYLEHEPFQVEVINKMAKEAGFKVNNFKDQYGVYRYSQFQL